jgi:fatty-acyl-CoA synthase
MDGLMQNDFPLSVHHMLRRMRTINSDGEVFTLHGEGDLQRTSFGEIATRVDRLARALEKLGIEPGDRVGTFAWNSQRHFEAYFAIPCLGAVLHTLNIRLFPEQMTYIANHAQDRVMFVDDSLVPLLEKLAPTFETVEHYIVMGDGDAGSLPNVLRYEELLADAGDGTYDFPEVDENTAAALCYTSGTTGNPKGVLYSHRSIALHSMAMTPVDALGLSRDDRVLAIVPMFHVNAWGLPFAAALTGSDLVMPTRFLQAAPLAGLIEESKPTLLAGVPTVLGDLLRHADEHGTDLSSLRGGVCGGAAVPRPLMEGYEQRHGVRILQAWGMTETSPLCTIANPPSEAAGEAEWDYRVRQGRVVPWVELRIMGDEGEQPWDGESTGEIEVRGPWIASRYFEDPSGDDKFHDGWLRTGDVAAVSAEGFVRITDRAKDLIKSGGEWISSVELETELVSHPDVLEAAVIAKPDEKWSERPLACVVLRDGAEPDVESLSEHLAARVARWQVPDEFAFIGEVPKTSVGKFDKKALRARLADGTLEGRTPVPSSIAGA